jgi:hypothetical protein
MSLASCSSPDLRHKSASQDLVENAIALCTARWEGFGSTRRRSIRRCAVLGFVDLYLSDNALSRKTKLPAHRLLARAQRTSGSGRSSILNLRHSLPYGRWRLRNERLTVPLIDGIERRRNRRRPDRTHRHVRRRSWRQSCRSSPGQC